VFDGILLMWNRRVVEKIEVCVGEYVVACSLRTILLLGFLWGFTVLITILFEDLYGRNWLAFLAPLKDHGGE
jgi:hypothetical protein